MRYSVNQHRMRLFTGIAIPADIRTTLARLMAHLRPAAQLKWTPEYNLHITTKFIGEWPPERVNELTRVLLPLQQRAPIPLEVRNLGWFPNPHVPRVFWAAIQAPPELAKLAQETEQACGTLGITVENKPFTPHLTLARVRQPVPLAHLRQMIAELASVEFGHFEAQSFHLYRSDPGPAGSIYTSLHEFPLTAA